MTVAGGGSSHVADGVVLLSDQASMLIIREAFHGARRFGEFKERLGISDAVLTGRLRNLADLGVFATDRYSDRPPRYEYRFTEKGEDFWSVTVGIWRWQTRWMTRRQRALPSMTHTVCGQTSTPLFGCGHCGGAVGSETALSTDLGRDEFFAVMASPPHRYRRVSWRPADTTSDLQPGLFDIVVDRWSLLIVLACFRGVSRFAEMQRLLGISPPLLSRRLAELVALGVVARSPLAGSSVQAYRLLDKGADLRPVLLLVHSWSARWAPDGGERRFEVVHDSCGRALDPVWFCDVCHGLLERQLVDFRYDS